MKARKAIFAGSWYPGSASACRREIEEFIKDSARSHAGDKKRVGVLYPMQAGIFPEKSPATSFIA